MIELPGVNDWTDLFISMDCFRIFFDKGHSTMSLTMGYNKICRDQLGSRAGMPEIVLRGILDWFKIFE